MPITLVYLLKATQDKSIHFLETLIELCVYLNRAYSNPATQCYYFKNWSINIKTHHV